MKLDNLAIAYIERKSDYDILNWNEFEMDIIDRYGNGGDADVKTINIYGKSHKEIIDILGDRSKFF